MDRSNHYERAFEAYLRHHRHTYVAVDEKKRSAMNEENVKSLDFIVFGPQGSRLLVDVKGRRYPSGQKTKSWQSWTMEEDVDALERWVQQHGGDYRGAFVFAYHLREGFVVPETTLDLFEWQQKRYLFRAIDVKEYRLHLRARSPRWKTVHVPTRAFRRLSRPVAHFLLEPTTVTENVPF